MRFSTLAVATGLPLLAAGAESPFAQYKAQFQNFLGRLGAKVPTPERHDPVEAASTKTGPMRMDILTLENWKETMLAPVKPTLTKPAEWWVLVTGGNKTCFGRCSPCLSLSIVTSPLTSLSGHCGKVEAAYNETAAIFASTTKPKHPIPNMAYINCEQQPILCNSWSAGTGRLWVFDIPPSGGPVEVYIKRMNLTTTTSKDFLDVWAGDHKTDLWKYDGAFHPFHGWMAVNGLAIPYAYLVWVFTLLPNWAFMLIISFISRTMM